MKRTFTYTGSTVENQARKYCREDISLIENYEQAKADNFIGWCCHHRLEYLPCQNRWVSKRELIDKGIYYNRPAWELIFMKRGDHNKLHNQDPYSKEKRAEAIRNSEKQKEALKKAREAAAEAHRKPFEIDGIRFEILDDAAKHFGVSHATIFNWLNGKRKTDHQCRYL